MPLDPTAYETVKILGDEDLPAEFRYPAIYQAPDFEKACADFRAYCEANHILYYARPRETFFMHEAFELAVEAGCTSLILEDMS